MRIITCIILSAAEELCRLVQRVAHANVHIHICIHTHMRACARTHTLSKQHRIQETKPYFSWKIKNNLGWCGAYWERRIIGLCVCGGEGGELLMESKTLLGKET